MLQYTLKNYAQCIFFRSALKLGPCQSTLKKICFFKNVLTHFEKHSKIKFCMAHFIFLV